MEKAAPPPDADPPETPVTPDPEPDAKPEDARQTRVYLSLVLVALLLLSALLSYQGIARSQRLGYGSPDDAMFVQFLWNTTEGRPGTYSMDSWFALCPECEASSPLDATTCTSCGEDLPAEPPPWERNYFAAHFDLSFLVYLPFFFLFPGSTVLFVIQPVLGLSGVIPLFLLARRKLRSPPQAAVVAGLFLLHPLLVSNSIRLGAYFVLTVPLLLWALERLDAGRTRASAVLFLLAVTTREETSLPIACFLLSLAVVDRKHRRFCLGLSALCLGWTFLYMGVLKSALFGQGPGMLGRYSHLGASIPEILVSPVARPGVFFSHLFAEEVLILALLLLLPLGPATLLAPRHLLAAAVPIAVVAVSAKASDRGLNHYIVPALPFLYAGLVIGLGRIREARERRPWVPKPSVLVALCLAGTFTLLAWANNGSLFKRYAANRALNLSHPGILAGLNPEYLQVNAWAADIPPDASVSADVTSLILLATRREVHPFPIRRTEVDFILVNTTPHGPRWPRTSAEAHKQQVVRAILEPGVKIERMGRFVLIDRREVKKAADPRGS